MSDHHRNRYPAPAVSRQMYMPLQTSYPPSLPTTIEHQTQLYPCEAVDVNDNFMAAQRMQSYAPAGGPFTSKYDPEKDARGSSVRKHHLLADDLAQYHGHCAVPPDNFSHYSHSHGTPKPILTGQTAPWHQNATRMDDEIAFLREYDARGYPQYGSPPAHRASQPAAPFPGATSDQHSMDARGSFTTAHQGSYAGTQQPAGQDLVSTASTPSYAVNASVLPTILSSSTQWTVDQPPTGQRRRVHGIAQGGSTRVSALENERIHAVGQAHHGYPGPFRQETSTAPHVREPQGGGGEEKLKRSRTKITDTGSLPIRQNEAGEYVCPQPGCGQCLNRPADARRHFRSHEGDEWQCPRCDTKCRRHDLTLRHFKSKHDPSGPRPGEEIRAILRH